MNWDAVWNGATALEARAWTAEFQIRSTSCATGRRTSSSGGCTPGAGSTANQEEVPVAAHPAPEHGAHASARRAARDPGASALPARRASAPTPRSSGQRSGGGGFGRGHGLAGPRCQGRPDDGLHARPPREPRLRQVEADPSVMNLTAYETFFEERRPFFSRAAASWDSDLRQQHALLLAPHRPRPVPLSRAWARGDDAPAGKHDDPRGGEGQRGRPPRVCRSASSRASRRGS